MASIRLEEYNYYPREREGSYPRTLPTTFMNDSSIFAFAASEPSTQEISACAFQIYQRSHCEPGHDLDNWREAIDCLKAKNHAARYASVEWELLVDL